MIRFLFFLVLFSLCLPTSAQFSITFSVDVSTSLNFNPNIHQLYLSGAKHNASGGIGNLPVWPIPGANSGFLMTQTSGSPNIFTVTINNVSPGAYAYKYFLVANNQPSWSLGEWGGTNNRVVVVDNANLNTNDVWGLMNPNQEVNLVINEIMASNSSSSWDEDGDYEDWIEIYNAGSSPVNLDGFGLSDELTNPMKWIFPSVFILPNQFLIVWASGKNKVLHNQPLHTNFNLSIDGEPLILANAAGIPLSTIPSVLHQTDVAYGCFPTASTNLSYLTNATPGSDNQGPSYDNLSAPLQFSIPEGYYTNSIAVGITSSDIDVVIRYTLDGSEPTEESPLYTVPLNFTNLSNVPNFFSLIPTNNINPGPPYYEGWEPPLGNVNKINVLRAKAFNPNTPNAPSFNATYIIDPLGANRYRLPVMSLTSDFEHLFDNQTGIYVEGDSGNFWQDWERPGNFTYFNKNGLLAFNENAGYQIHGNFSRSRPRKSLRMIFRNNYGKSWLDYPIFENKATEKYKQLILRNAGNDWGNSLIRDGISQILAKNFNLEVQYFQPLILFINGEYWGIHNLRDRYNASYFEAKYGILEDEFTSLENNMTMKDGNPNGLSHYQGLYSFIQNNSLSVPSNYLNVVQKMDISSFIDFQLAHIYTKNTDWPGNNAMYWRFFRSDFDSSAGVRDGRWRWMIYDLDFAFDLDLNYVPHLNAGPAHNTLAFALEPNGPQWPNPSWSTLMLRKLIENDTFKIQFVNRYCDLLNTVYKPEFVISTIDSISNLLLPEMQEHINRWRSPESVESWMSQIEDIKTFAQDRAGYQFQHLQSIFELGNKYTLTVDVNDEVQGFVKLNSIPLKTETNGIYAPVFPWQGSYLQGVPIRLIALPKQGFTFSHWTGAITGTDPEIVLYPNEAINVKAHFKPIDLDSFELLHFWFFGTTIQNDQPLSEIQPTFSTHYAFLNYESCLVGYPFQVGHTNWRKASMERRNAPTPLNYTPEGNDGVLFSSANMRGIQIKQPFYSQGNENTLLLKFSTKSFEHILLQFAAKDEGASAGIYVDYKTSSQALSFSSLGIVSAHTLDQEFRVFQVDFSQVQEVNDLDTFVVRIRFMGENMTLDSGHRVSLNNISVKGIPMSDDVEEQPQPIISDFVLYPNPAQDAIYISTIDPLLRVELYAPSGQMVTSYNTQGNQYLDLRGLACGFYVVKAFFEGGLEKATRLVKIH